ncbi:MAG: hypothetical protein IJZ79_01845 [Bacilli bacterium]|nr:hypothetical protein [Bacilli bacterium]
MRRNNDFETQMLEDIFGALGVIVAMADPMTQATSRKTRPTSCACNSRKCQSTQPNTYKLTDFVDRIISQDTATVIFWKDGTSTRVKCSADEGSYDYEKGIAMAVMKYVFGNRYYRDMQKLMDVFPHVETEPKADSKKIEAKNKKALEDKNVAKKSTKKSTKSDSTKKSANKTKKSEKKPKTDNVDKKIVEETKVDDTNKNE